MSSNKKISCGTYPIFLCQPNKLENISLLSTNIDPEVGLSNPNIKFTNVLFPCPLAPTIPMQDPFSIIKFTLLNKLELESKYLNVKFFKVIFFVKEK